MRREIKLIILVFVLVVGPAIALSFLSARVLESWQIVLQKRLAGVASRVLDEAVKSWDRELLSLRTIPVSAGVPPNSVSGWVAHAAGLSLRHTWVDGFFVFQPGSGLLYPSIETFNPEFDHVGTATELESLLNLGGENLGKGDTNSAVECFEKVGRAGIQDSGFRFQVGRKENDFQERDPEEGFFYDLIALKRLAEIFISRGDTVRVDEIRKCALERVLLRYDKLVPLQRDSMVEWVDEGLTHSDWLMVDDEEGATIRFLLAQWHERMRGRALAQGDRAGLIGGISMVESSIPDSGWITMRVQQTQYLVTGIMQPDAGSNSLVIALQYNESALTQHLNNLFTVAASNTDIRVRCRTGSEENIGPILASRQLSPPLNALSLVATPEDVPAFMANARLQTWLYRGGGVLLLISVVAGVWLVWREAAMEIRQARERSDFAAVVSHDLRTPLSSMRMLAESLYMGNVTDENKRKKFLGAIIKESDRLSRLTDRALYFIRYGQGALRYQFTEGDLGGVVREVTETFAVGVGSDVKITMNISPDIPPVRFDTGAIEQVVYNLLDNAVKYSPKDKSVRIEVGLGVEAGKIALSVKDYGAGMTLEEVRHVLKPYRRGKNAERQNARGIGLGLALCQHVVQAHGGRIQIQSEPGKGSVFTILLQA